ncbi:L,D-transpeptidase [Polymorphobacter sp.]|uniref:L,D-transpeptidase n=1 Tax=Polymorphobacter sp. TaxID=1909290 RepID=UPI003F7148F1
MPTRRLSLLASLLVTALAALPAHASPAAVHKAAAVIAARDNAALPFLVIDKAQARVLAYAPDGTLIASAPALLGLTPGDTAPADIGLRTAAQIGPADRITPAGRFTASLGQDFVQDLLWVDYNAGLSLHRVVKGSPKDRRADRLASPTTQDNRISFGCINVPAAFYDDVIRPLFANTVGIVYILPEATTAPRPIELASQLDQ